MSRWLVALAGAALLVLGAAWFLSAYERSPVREWVAPSGEARRNPYLAAERFFARMGLVAAELGALPELDALEPRAALLMPNRRQALDPRRMRTIVAWVEAGGHLIAEAELIGVPDPLLESFGVRRSAAPAASKRRALEVAPGRLLDVSLFGTVTLHAPRGEAGRYVSFAHGKGRVSALASLHFARNEVIGANDNAEFLWHLARLTPATKLAVYLRPERLSLWGFLVEHAAPALAAAAALAALWLWRVAPRFGPVRPDPAPARRRLLDHLRASGRYFWARGLRLRLLAAARDAALRRIVRAQPDFAAASARERLDRISSLAGISREEAERFLDAGAVSGAQFIRVVHSAQRIHQALERGNR